MQPTVRLSWCHQYYSLEYYYSPSHSTYPIGNHKKGLCH